MQHTVQQPRIFSIIKVKLGKQTLLYVIYYLDRVNKVSILCHYDALCIQHNIARGSTTNVHLH
jgi:hypothetical protein